MDDPQRPGAPGTDGRNRDVWGSSHIAVDAMNVIGSRPNGWWRDRDAAVVEFVQRVARFAAGLDGQLHVVLDGRPVEGATNDDVTGLDIRYAARRGPDAADDSIVDLLEELGDADGTLAVVTADGQLRARAEARGAVVIGPTSLLRRLDQHG